MRSSRDKTGITWLLILVLLPWLIDYWYYREQFRQDERDDKLFKQYDCFPLGKCVADFDGDGSPARFEVIPCEGREYGCLIALESGREIIRLKHAAVDGTLRTHAAVSDESGGSRLLIYDGASHPEPLRAAFAWDGEKLSAATPTGFEREIINAMAAHDDTGSLVDRVINRGLARSFSFLVYYLLLLFFICVLAFGKYNAAMRKYVSN